MDTARPLSCGVIGGDVKGKKVYDPRSYMKKAEASMKQRVIQAAEELKSLGKTLYEG